MLPFCGIPSSASEEPLHVCLLFGVKVPFIETSYGTSFHPPFRSYGYLRIFYRRRYAYRPICMLRLLVYV